MFKGAKILYSLAFKRTLHSYSSLSPKTVARINSHGTRIAKIISATKSELYALAILIALKPPAESLSLELQQVIVRGLCQYHPRLMPINLNALTSLHRKTAFSMDSIDKATLMASLFRYGDQQVIRSGLNFVGKVPGGPIPLTSIMALVEFAKERHSIEVCVAMWQYIREQYPLTLHECTVIMTDLMQIFSRSRTYQKLAGDVARACVGNVSNPNIALSIARVSYMLKDQNLMHQLRKSPGFRMTPVIESVMAQLDAKEGKLEGNHDHLSPQAFSGVVKAIAERNLQKAESMVDDISKKEEGGAKTLLAQIALCNQYIHEKSLTKFNEAYYTIRSLNCGSGILLNLKLTWELHHGTFWRAKRHYQNFKNVPHKQRIIALNTLSRLAIEEADHIWVAAQRRTLESSVACSTIS